MAAPDGWPIGRPGWEDRYQHRSMYAFDPSEPAVYGGREQQWIAVGQTELDYVHDMAYCLGESKSGRWPK